MHPILCQIGPFTVFSYGFMLAVAVLLCSYLMQKDAKRKGIDPNVIADFIFWTLVGGLIGARIFFILLNWPYFLKNPLEIIMLQHGGLAWQGGLILGVISAYIFLARRRLSFLQIADLAAPYLALGQAIGRIGCFLNGCCYGKPVLWGIYFPVHGARLHPTQLYSSAGLFLIFFLLKKMQRLQRYKGQIFIDYLILASSLRFIVEFFRNDHVAIGMGLSIFQIMTLIFIVFALYARILLTRR